MPDATTIIGAATPLRTVEAPIRAKSAPPIEVRVWLFGLIARMAAKREVYFELPAGATVADVLAALGERFGGTMLDELMRTRKEKSSACRISVNGHLIHDLESPLGEAATTVEIIVLSAYEGG